MPNYAQNAHNAAAGAHRHMAQNAHRAHQRQMDAMTRHGGGSPRRQRHDDTGLGFPGDEDLKPNGGRNRRRTGMVVLMLLLLLGTVGAGLWLAAGRPSPTSLLPNTSVSGTVRPGTSWNVRGGPGMDHPPISVVHPGQSVTVACTTRGWLRITAPVTGYVGPRGIELDRPAKPC